MPTIKGTASVSDLRARRKALKGTKFPENFSQQIQLEKVNKQVLSQWIEQKVNSILGFEDEIVASMAINLFLPEEDASPDPKRAQLDLVGFLGEEESASFANELWTLMLEAQESTSGIPKTLLEKKKEELARQAASRPPQQHQQDGNRNQRRNRFADGGPGRALPPPQGDRNPPPVSPTHSVEEHPPRRPYDGDRGENGRNYNRRPDHDRIPPNPNRRRPEYNPYPPNDRRYDNRYDYERSRRGPSERFHGGRDRSFSPDRDRARWGRDDRRREDEDSRRRYDRRRYYSEEDEMQLLERRLDVLEREYASRTNDYALADEIEDIKDRLYELDRRRRRYRRERDDDRRRGRRESPRGRRSRSPRERRRRESSSRSRSMDGRGRRRRSRGSESRSSESRNSRSRSADRRASDRPQESRSQRTTAERSYSSESSASGRSSDGEKRSSSR